MEVNLGYSNEIELIPIEPLIKREINRDIKINLIKIKEDKIKFNLDNLDLVYIPLPLTTLIEDMKVITNGAFIVDKIGIKFLKSENIKNWRVCVDNTNSPEYYLLKIFTNFQINLGNNDQCEMIISLGEYDYSLTEIWKKSCGNVPIVFKVLGSKKADEEFLNKIKIMIRESALIQEKKGMISQFSRELGLKGREAINCFIELCRKKGICGKYNPIIL